MKNDDTKKLKRELEILNNLNRLNILKYLKNKKERSVGNIADGAGLSFKTTSRQLLYLSKKGILERRYDGPFVLYSIANNISGPARLILSKLPPTNHSTKR